MAAIKRTQNIEKVIITVICGVFILTAVPVWGMGQVAHANTVSSTSTGILICWDNGSSSLESLNLQASESLRLAASLKALPGGVESLQGAEWLAPDIQVMRTPEGTPVDQAMKQIASIPGVRYVEPDTVVRTDASPQDPYYSSQWFLPHIGTMKAWDVEKGSGDLVVAVLDTGVDASHPDLAGRVLNGYDFVGKDGNTSDVYGHGTHVAGIIAASGENNEGVAGLAWRIKLLPVKVLDDNGSGSYSNVIAGIRYAIDNGAMVINLSLGGGARSQALQEAVDYARSKGAVVVAAAGNEAHESLSYPAACDGVIGVGATDEQDRRTQFSDWGVGLDIMAPGTSVYSDIPGGRYGYKSGTSMAAPQVSGAFALLRSHEPGLSVAEAEERIFSSARDLGSQGYDTDYGWGVLRVDKALGLKDEVPGGQEYTGGELYFAEGYTSADFDTYVLLENPGKQASSAHLDFYGPQGLSASTEVEVGSQARLTLRLNDIVPPGDVATRISLPKDSEIMAQRSMYFNFKGID